jgi:hypothetical protein
MPQLITIKLTSGGPNVGPFQIWDDFGNLIKDDVSKEELKHGLTLSFNDNVLVVVIKSVGSVLLTKYFSISSFDRVEYGNTVYTDKGNACLWRHVDTPLIYNNFYGNIEPYIIEYPFAYSYHDEIAHNIQDYTKVYKYVDTEDNNVWADYAKYELDDAWFNKAILYNGQQCSGILTLVPKPVNNLQAYMLYPILGNDEKTITYTKSDNFYQYNTFWSITKDTKRTHFIKHCSSLSIDKVINQSNMDYSQLPYKKATLRAKELKVRHIMDDRDDIHLVSQFIVVPSQRSYK